MITGSDIRNWRKSAGRLTAKDQDDYRLLQPFSRSDSRSCAFGPHVLERSYAPYHESLRHVDEEELLRGLVHMRYNETPGFLSVASIAAQYELSGQAEARPFCVAPNPTNSNGIFRTFTAILPDVSAMGANRPTVSLTPGDDSDAIRRFLTPMTGENLQRRPCRRSLWNPSGPSLCPAEE